jgi:Fungal specific transcription factor domain
MQYLGSLYASEVSSTELHAVVMSQLDIPNLPPNGFTVQMLLLTAIAVHCDGELEEGRAILDRAIYLALEIRMNSRAFATMERDPVLAESWRRTFWGLYISDAYFATMRRAPMFTYVRSILSRVQLTDQGNRLHSVEADVEIPCEECDYDGVSPLICF